MRRKGKKCCYFSRIIRSATLNKLLNNKKMKVLHVIRSLHKAGAEKLCIDICRELHKRPEIEVLLVSMSPINQFEDLTKDLPLRFIDSKVFPSILGKNTIDINEYLKVVEEFKPDIIHTHLFWTELLTRHVTFQGIKYVTHCHDNIGELETFSLKTLFSKKRIIRYFERLWIINKYKKCNNNFLVISEDTKKYFEKILPKSIKNIKLLHNAVDYEQYKRPDNYLSKNSNDILKIISVGRFAVYKNQKFLLRIFEELQCDYPNLELHFYGTGECFDEVQKKGNEISKNIFFHGIVSNVAEKLWNASFFVHVAYYEPYGLVLLEAMSAGLPVVTLDGKGNRDLIIQGENGFMIYNQDPKEFANTIKMIWENKDLYSKLSANGIEFARKNDINNYTSNLIEYYNDLLKGNNS
jgi:glycosyltransferase involved in cell wall biosynthesis